MSVTAGASGSIASDSQLGILLPASRPKRRPNVFGRRWSLLLAVTDITMFLIAAIAAIEIVKHGDFRPVPSDPVVIATLAYAAFWLLIFERLGLYRRTVAMTIKDELYSISAALALGAVPQMLLYSLVPAVSSSRMILFLSMLFAVMTVGGSRAALFALRAYLSDQFPQRVAVVGDASRVESVLHSLNFGSNTRVLALTESDVEATLEGVTFENGARLNQVPWLRQAAAWGCDSILLTEILPPSILPLLLEMAARERITLAFAPPRICAHAYDYTLRTDGHQALIIPFQLRACRPVARVWKRTMDLSVASLAMIVALPIMAVAALAILVESGRPIFFTQERVGLDGRVFNLLKFRSMRVDAESKTGPVWAKANDPRKTRLGKLLRRMSIDELPQLLNVLRGEMSLVGPRPERPVFVKEFRKLLPRYDERHLVRPGITGWSQVHMKRVLAVSDAAEKLDHDLYYVENWSVFMDVSLIVKTAFEVLFHKAA